MSPYPNNPMLRRPTIEDKESILDMIDEYYKKDSSTAGLWNFSHSDFSFCLLYTSDAADECVNV